jgi:protein-S-isoprenylcysteine O-methyltransferase Ste14
MLYAALIGLPFLDRREITSISTLMVCRWAGVVLFSLGIGLVFWSGLALGKLYSADVTLQNDHKLITDGPYKLIRHPRYSGGILLGFGLGFLFNSWAGLLGSLIFFPIILFRIQDEEKLMREAFSEEWQEYCGKTKRLIPFIY